MALCKLIIEGEEKGLYWFIIPLRNKKGEIKVGVNVGDIGPKAGRNGLDNGWIQFSSVSSSFLLFYSSFSFELFFFNLFKFIFLLIFIYFFIYYLNFILILLFIFCIYYFLFYHFIFMII